MAQNRKLKIAAAIVGSWLALAAVIILLVARQVITAQMALLMLIALVGLYFGFGVLIAAYRFVATLE